MNTNETAAATPSGQTITVDPAVVMAETGSEAVLLHVDTGMYFGLDEVAALMWKLLSAGKSVSEIRDTVASEYSVDPARVENDLTAFVEQLHANALVRTPEAS